MTALWETECGIFFELDHKNKNNSQFYLFFCSIIFYNLGAFII